MEEKLSIRLNIAERFYSLKIEKEEEEKVRAAAKMISDKLLSLKQKQPSRDVQDWLAMACLWFSMKLIDTEKDQDVDVATIEEIQNIDQQIADYLEYAVVK
ncbi:hypothetical protein FACS189467_6150 [Bacteroidia bacterium]|nr:hypothetical protein FACS189467_6150 [Bacteroidia bacterium]